MFVDPLCIADTTRLDMNEFLSRLPVVPLPFLFVTFRSLNCECIYFKNPPLELQLEEKYHFAPKKHRPPHRLFPVS
jgi:hypothetical protein